MERPRIYRGLRIAASSVCLIAYALLVVLWVRSYWWVDRVSGPLSRTRQLVLESSQGSLMVRFDDTSQQSKPTQRWRVSHQSFKEMLIEMRIRAGVPQLTITYPKFAFIDSVGFGSVGFYLAHWLLLLPTGLLAVALGIRRPYRFSFSLRTLLIATTVIAVVLGLVMWSIR